MKFIKTMSGNTILNLAHVHQISICPPKFEQRDYIVCAVGNGTHILHRGTEQSCKVYLAQLFENINNND